MKSEPERRVPVHRWEQVDRWVQVGASMCCGAVRKRVLKVEGTEHTPVCCTNLRACCCFFEAEENCCHVMVVPGAYLQSDGAHDADVGSGTLRACGVSGSKAAHESGLSKQSRPRYTVPLKAGKLDHACVHSKDQTQSADSSTTTEWVGPAMRWVGPASDGKGSHGKPSAASRPSRPACGTCARRMIKGVGAMDTKHVSHH
jgi:hypothetical protein